MTEDPEKLIAEYERLRRRAHELDVTMEQVDRRLTEIEEQLPDWYRFPDGVPQSNATARACLYKPT